MESILQPVIETDSEIVYLAPNVAAAASTTRWINSNRPRSKREIIKIQGDKALYFDSAVFESLN